MNDKMKAAMMKLKSAISEFEASFDGSMDMDSEEEMSPNDDPSLEMDSDSMEDSGKSMMANDSKKSMVKALLKKKGY